MQISRIYVARYKRGRLYQWPGVGLTFLNVVFNRFHLTYTVSKWKTLEVAMDIGTGIFLGLVFLGLILLYLKTRQTWKWRRVVGYPVLAFAIFGGISLAVYGTKSAFDGRVRPVTEFLGIKLTDTQADIKFKKGNPTDIEDVVWSYRDEQGSSDTSFSFKEDNKLRIIFYTGNCSYCNRIFDLGIGTTFDAVIDKLGQPESIDTSEDFLMRLASFEKFNLIFQFAEGKVIGYGMYNPAFGPIKFKNDSDEEKEKRAAQIKERKEFDAISTIVE